MPIAHARAYPAPTSLHLGMKRYFHQRRVERLVVPSRPHMQPEDEAVFVEELGRAHRYLEYGAGGSTVIAAELGVATVCVENDRAFAEAVERRIDPLSHNVVVHFADIGTTGRWGRPIRILATRRTRKKYPDYVYAGDQYCDTDFFDCVLVDGRFRVACALYAIRRAVSAGAPCLICFDDYRFRSDYHVVEEFCRPERVGSHMAFFRPDPACLVRLPEESEIHTFCQKSR